MDLRRAWYLQVFVATAIVAAGLLVSPVQAAQKGPAEVKKGDKCAVCGMFVEKYKEWVAQVVFADGSAAFFDGPKDMFRYYFNISRYNPSKKQSDIDTLYVTEYYSTKIMDAKKVLFVTGSDVYGPMGTELVPVETEEHAREFMKDHKGKRALKFSDVTAEDVK